MGWNNYQPVDLVLYCPWSRSLWFLVCTYSARSKHISVLGVLCLFWGQIFPQENGTLSFLLLSPKHQRSLYFRRAQLVIKKIQVKWVLDFFSLYHTLYSYFSLWISSSIEFFTLFMGNCYADLFHAVCRRVQALYKFFKLWLAIKAGKRKTNFPV